MPISVRAFFLVGLVVVGSTLPAAQATLAQSSGAARDGAVARVGLRPGQEARAIRRFDLTLADAVERALERNRQIAVQRISPLVRDMQVATANAAFSPLASSGFGLNQATQPSTSFLDGGGLRGASIVTDQGSYDVGVSQRMRRGGGRFELTWNSNRLKSTNSFSNFNPSLAATTSLTYTQPLLRGLRTDSARTQLVVSRIDRAIADIDIEETIVNTLADVRLAYWELVHARAAVDVQQQSLALAEQLVRDNRARVEIGMVGEIEVVQARAEAALRRQSLAEAFRVLRTNELALKLLIVGGRPDELWNAEIDPTDRPRTDAIPIDLEAAIRAALDRRTDISRVRRQVDINDAMVENLRNSTLPALDLIGSYQLTRPGRSPTAAFRDHPRGDSRGRGRRDPGRLWRCRRGHPRGGLPVLECPDTDDVPARSERGRGGLRAGAAGTPAERGPAPVDRAPDRWRGHQRRATGSSVPGEHPGRHGRAGAGGGTVAGRGDQVRGRAVDELPGRADAARAGRCPGVGATGDPRLPAGGNRVRPCAARLARQQWRDVLKVQQGSLHPALYRLEKEDWIAGQWAATETGREAKFYSLTAAGRAHLKREVAAWERLSGAINLVIQQA